MIHDYNKDFLYLADTLPLKHPKFYKDFCKVLSERKINFNLIPNTKDIWCRDYMPIQNACGDFVQFTYTPDYLKSTKYLSTITNVSASCRKLKIETIKSDYVIDGGNVVYCGGKVIMCDKVLNENPNISRKELIEDIRKLLRVNHVLLIPTHPEDFCGHVDGILRFLDKRTVLINDFKKESPKYRNELLAALQKHKLKWIEVPYNTANNKTSYDASGIYINFLQMKGVIFLPIYGLKEDADAIKLFSKVFSMERIIPIKCNSIAKRGGVLNCISWTIKSNYPKPLSAFEKELDRDIICLGLED